MLKKIALVAALAVASFVSVQFGERSASVNVVSDTWACTVSQCELTPYLKCCDFSGVSAPQQTP